MWGQSGPREQVKFIKTDNVRIIDGPFLGFNGVVDEVDQDHAGLKSWSVFLVAPLRWSLGFCKWRRI